MFSKEDKINRTKTVFNTAADHFDAPALSFVSVWMFSPP